MFAPARRTHHAAWTVRRIERENPAENRLRVTWLGKLAKPKIVEGLMCGKAGERAGGTCNTACMGGWRRNRTQADPVQRTLIAGWTWLSAWRCDREGTRRQSSTSVLSSPDRGRSDRAASPRSARSEGVYPWHTDRGTRHSSPSLREAERARAGGWPHATPHSTRPGCARCS